MTAYRYEQDCLGEKKIPEDVYWGIHSLRAMENFRLSDHKIDPMLIRAYGYVKKACCHVNAELELIQQDKAAAIIKACDEMIEGKLNDSIVVDPFAGGAGTSVNMNVNEVICNRALEFLGKKKGEHKYLDPIADVNLYQSTNDTFPTAIKVASLIYLKELETELIQLHQVFMRKEKEFSSIVKIGRTEMQEAVPITLGMEFSGYAESFSQDRWRVFKARERLRTINLGATAVGTGLGAPRQYIFMVTDVLKILTGLNLCRAENLVYPTQSVDSFCEASGILKTSAANFIKIAKDIRLMASLKEIILPSLQAGSSIMPGKINPVICEATIQVGLKCLSNDALIGQICAMGTLEINEFLPLLSMSFLESLVLLKQITKSFSGFVDSIKADEKVCLDYLNNSSMIMTAFVPFIGYDKVGDLNKEYEKIKEKKDLSVREFLNEKLSKKMVEKILSAENLTKLGFDIEKDN
ncbi:MAG: aspartate ammonia-lyase [Candidatus Omnitrophica bacterium]|nr:aspartate ammonia-lyase [Candidatus Omnitrophota bacterium]